MNSNKAVRPGGIVTETLPALDDVSIDKITEVINETYNSVHIPY